MMVQLAQRSAEWHDRTTSDIVSNDSLTETFITLIYMHSHIHTFYDTYLRLILLATYISFTNQPRDFVLLPVYLSRVYACATIHRRVYCRLMFQLFYLYIINFPDLFYDILGLFDWLFHSVEHCCECLSLYLSTFTTTFMVPANRIMNI